MEFLIAGVGLALAVWMILGARHRHRSTRKDRDGQPPARDA
jgi:hypothetical protein